MTPETVSVDTLTSTIHSQASRAKTDQERYLLHRLATDLANRIRQVDNKNFNQGIFLEACGIQPEWGKLTAAA